MTYRRYRADDFPALYALEERCFQPPQRFDREYMLSLLANPEGAAWISEEEGRLAGFAIADWTEMRGQKLGYIQTLEVTPEARRRGVGQELLRLLENSARHAACRYMWLHVDVENTPAVRLYERAGYHRKGTRADYYGAGKPAAVYSRNL